MLGLEETFRLGWGRVGRVHVVEQPADRAAMVDARDGLGEQAGDAQLGEPGEALGVAVLTGQASVAAATLAHAEMRRLAPDLQPDTLDTVWDVYADYACGGDVREIRAIRPELYARFGKVRNGADQGLQAGDIGVTHGLGDEGVAGQVGRQQAQLTQLLLAQVLHGATFGAYHAAAVAAVEGTIDREDEDVAASIALVVLFGTLMIPLIPLLVGLLSMDIHSGGLLAGAATHSTARGENVLDEGDPAACDIGSFGQATGAVCLGLLANEKGMHLG